MSLYSAIQIASNAIRAQQIGLQVAGQNISNANTPGYVREEVVLQAAPTQKMGGLLLGMGVQVHGVIQKVDRFLQERLLSAGSDRKGAETLEQAHLKLETLISELSDVDLSTSLNKFFASISEVLNQPESRAARNLAVQQGKTLTQDFNRLANRVLTARTEANDRTSQLVGRTNELLEEIRQLNIRIADTEGGGTSNSDAVGLRDQRTDALTKLSEILDVKVEEQPSGAVNVFTNGDYLVFDGTARKVASFLVHDRGLNTVHWKIEGTDAPVEPNSGELHALFSARDDVLGGFVDRLNDLAGTLAFEFNRLHSSGQGISGYRSVTSEFTVSDRTVALDQAQLPFSPSNGSFQLQVFDTQTGRTQTTDLLVDLNGLGDDTSLEDLAASLDAIVGVSAEIDTTGHLSVKADSPAQRIAFANDTSGILAALGINTFFSGSTATDLGINKELLKDPSLFAASRTGIGEDTDIALEMAGFIDRPLETQNGDSLGVAYSRLVGETTQGAQIARANAQGAKVFYESLNSQHLAISGVSVDEEVIRMIAYQRGFQAAARFISTLNDLFGTLVNL